MVGKPTGRIAWAPNKGTKEQPKFEGIADLAGENPAPAAWMLPSQWDLEIGQSRGNSSAYASCVSAQEDPAADARQGTRALKFGFAGASDRAPAARHVDTGRPFG